MDLTNAYEVIDFEEAIDQFCYRQEWLAFFAYNIGFSAGKNSISNPENSLGELIESSNEVFHNNSDNLTNKLRKLSLELDNEFSVINTGNIIFSHLDSSRNKIVDELKQISYWEIDLSNCSPFIISSLLVCNSRLEHQKLHNEYKTTYNLNDLKSYIEQEFDNAIKQVNNIFNINKNDSLYSNPNTLHSEFENIQLEKLFEFLHPEFITSDIKIFKSIFSQNILPLNKPIQWKQSNRLLAYFFQQLCFSNLLKCENNEWQSIIEKNNLFVNKKNKPFKATDLSSALTEIQNANPKHYDQIDSILKEIKTLRV